MPWEPWEEWETEESVIGPNGSLEVDWEPPAVVGWLYFPDGSYREVLEERPTFGFARWLD